jgi:hypothetical protein
VVEVVECGGGMIFAVVECGGGMIFAVVEVVECGGVWWGVVECGGVWWRWWSVVEA